MLRFFYISIAESVEQTKFLKHIEYSVYKHLKSLKYVSFRRIDIEVEAKEIIEAPSVFHAHDIARIKLSLGSDEMLTIQEKKTINTIYSKVFDSLKILWLEKSWSIEDLSRIHDQIPLEQLPCTMLVGKPVASKSKKYKAIVRCEVYTDYADYFVDFMEKGKAVHSIHFLKGSPIIQLFLGFFHTRSWNGDDFFIFSDLNKEIFYVFNRKEEHFTIEYRPIYNTEEQCKRHVRAFEFDVTNSERLEIMGIPVRD